MISTLPFSPTLKLTKTTPFHHPTTRIRTRNQTPTPTQTHLPYPSKHGFGVAGPKLGFCIRAKDDNFSEVDKELEELRRTNTMPDRFRYLTHEPPSKPLLWPFFLASAFLIYAWRSVLWELSNWRNLIIGIFQFIGYLLKAVLALIFHFIGDPITYTIFYIETALHAVRSFYSSIVTSAPIPELTLIIMLASTVLAIGEAVSPNSVNQQPYLITLSGIIGYGAVRGIISEPVFWLLLFGLFSFAKFIKRRDDVSSALPVAAVLASVGEPWVRLLSIISFTALAIQHHSKNTVEGKGEVSELNSPGQKVPFPLVAIALAIGIHVAAKWAGYQHLTWMVV